MMTTTMTNDEIIRMAREAGFTPNGSTTVLPMTDYASNGVSYELERFAALVAAHEREAQDRLKDHLSDAEEIIQRMMREREAAVLAEREAVLEIVYTVGGPFAEQCAEAIRARSEK